MEIMKQQRVLHLILVQMRTAKDRIKMYSNTDNHKDKKEVINAKWEYECWSKLLGLLAKDTGSEDAIDIIEGCFEPLVKKRLNHLQEIREELELLRSGEFHYEATSKYGNDPSVVSRIDSYQIEQSQRADSIMDYLDFVEECLSELNDIFGLEIKINSWKHV